MTASPTRSCTSRRSSAPGIPTLNEGDRLEFELEVDRRGKYAAVNLQPEKRLNSL